LNDPFKSYLLGPFSFFIYKYIYMSVKDAHDDGHCYGMSALAMNYFYEHLPTPSEAIPYQLDYSQIDEDIEYYHNKQIIDLSTFSILYFWGKPNSPISNTNQWDIIKESIEGGNPIIIGLQSASGSRHAVIGYALNDDGDVLIYDPTYPATEQDPINIIDITEGNSEVTISYEWDSGTVWNSWVALSYEQASIVEKYFDKVKNSLWFLANCPLELKVYDQNGTEIGESLSDGETHMVVVTDPSNEEYKVELTGTGEGPYNLSIGRYYNGVMTYQNSTGTITLDEIIEEKLTVTGGQIELHDDQTPTDDGDDDQDMFIFAGFGALVVLVIVVSVGIMMKKKRMKGKDKLQERKMENLKTTQPLPSLPSQSLLSTQVPQQAPQQQPPQTTPEAPVEIPAHTDGIWTCNKCKKKWPMGELFCGKCGMKRQEYWKCPNCGNEVDGINNFCTICGTQKS